ncbi:hypothetical protein EDB85DRAFT_2022836 [Lactarius pseudohatsudake]|nr:hypothetical protein EDB85DRAFT_2022836 [Lactarius pseudohatsudake]
MTRHTFTKQPIILCLVVCHALSTSLRPHSFPFPMPPGMGSFLPCPGHLHSHHGRAASARSLCCLWMTPGAMGSFRPSSWHLRSRHCQAADVQPRASDRLAANSDLRRDRVTTA